MFANVEEIRTATNEELLKAVTESIGHTGTKKDDLNSFQNYFGVDFNYANITNELTKRGFINGWYLPQSENNVREVKVKLSKNNARMNLNMTQECKERYEKFLEDKSNNFVHTTAAIMSYLDGYEDKSMRVFVEL